MLQVGQLLQERYQLQQQLGKNAGRQTWLAEDLAKHPSEPVIVKFLAFGDQVDWDDLKLFEREANILKQLNHPQIPKYRDYFSIDDRILWFGLVQESIPGLSLKELIMQGRRFSETEVKKIAVDVLQILVYLHELNPTVLHRDIKPSNLILAQNEKIYLVDFGAVQDRAATEGATFTVVGTYGYAPMEQFGGRAVPASDLYALGATLIHLLTGTAPADLPQRNMRIQFRDKVNLNPNFIDWIETLIEPDIEQRASTARQALDTLRNNSNYNSYILAKKPYDSRILDTPRNNSNSNFYILPKKPYGSRIQLNKSSSQLEIKIPAKGKKYVVLLYTVCLIFIYLYVLALGSVHFPLLLIFFLIGLIPISLSFLSAFGEVYLAFDKDSFLISWNLFGLSYRQYQRKTWAIRRVDKGNGSMQAQGTSPMGVTIQASIYEYTFAAFAPPITEDEQDWLVEEIRDWLGIKPTTPVVTRQDSPRTLRSQAKSEFLSSH